MKALLATSFAIALSFQTPSALAQAAPGAGPDIAALSSELQNNRNSAASIHAQAQEIRRLKALARETVAPTPDITPAPDETGEPVGESSDDMFAIPTGNGLVPARNKRTPAAPAELEKVSSVRLPPVSGFIQSVDLN